MRSSSVSMTGRESDDMGYGSFGPDLVVNEVVKWFLVLILR